MHHHMDSPSGFEPTEEVAGERSRTWVLDSSPNVLPSRASRPWLEQGMSDCAFLAPQQVKKLSSASPLQSMTFDSRASSLNVPAWGSSLSCTDLPSTTDTIYNSPAPLSVDPGTESPHAFFTARLGSSKKKRGSSKKESGSSKKDKVERLVSLVQGFSEGFSNGFYERLSGWHNFWSEREVVLEGESISGEAFEDGVARRLRRLKQARYSIKKKDWRATRLWLVFFVHEVEYISQWEDIGLYTSKGVDSMSAAMTMATKYLDTARSDYDRGRNMVQIMKEGGPASLLGDGGLAQSMWESHMTLEDITCTFAYIRDKLPDLHERVESHNQEVSKAIRDGFQEYGWSFSGLLDSNTKVMVTLKPYLQLKRPHADDGPGDSESENKRWRVDQSGASSSLPDHDFPANSSNSGSNDFDQATSSCNTVESTPGSNSIHLISSDTKNRTRDLIDPATAGHLSHAVSSLDEFIDRATADNLVYAVNDTDEFADPATTSKLDYANEITDLATANFLQSTDNQLVNMLSSADYGMDQDPSVALFFQWAFGEQAELTDRLRRDSFEEQPPSSRLTIPSTPDCIDPCMMRTRRQLVY